MEELRQEDLDQLPVYCVLDNSRLMKNVIGSYDSFVDRLPHIVNKEFRPSESINVKPPKDGIRKVDVSLEITDVVIEPPNKYSRTSNMAKYPNEVRKSNDSYAGSMYATMTLSTTKHIETKVKGVLEAMDTVVNKVSNFYLGDIPVMEGSKLCHKTGKSKETLMAQGEDPNAPGGNFIVSSGSSKRLISRKNNIKNKPTISRDQKGIIRCKFSSQMGEYYEQSKFITLTLLPSMELLVEIPIKKDLDFVVPFYILYYLFEVTNDYSIFKTVLPNFDPSLNRDLMMDSFFRQSMSADYIGLKDTISKDNKFSWYENLDDIRDEYELFILVARILHVNDTSKSYTKDFDDSSDEAKREIYKTIKTQFDSYLLPHIGIKPEDRINKLETIGSFIHKMYGVILGDKTTDRNSLENIVVYGAAPGLVGSFKSVFNYAVVTHIMQRIASEIKNNPNADIVKIMRSKHDSGQLGSIMNKALSAGNKSEISFQKNRSIKNRISTVQDDDTNYAAKISIAASITVDPTIIEGKAGEPALLVRSVHPSEQEVKCLPQSIEGSDAGIVGQMAISGEITDDINPRDVLEFLEGKLSNEKNNNGVVYVNGKPVGTHHDTRLLARELRQARRDGKIFWKHSIKYSPLENKSLEISTFIGRMTRPMIIVYQNREEYEDKYNSWPTIANDSESYQYILFTVEHAKLLRNNQITLRELAEQGVIEYISANENMNIIACDSLEVFNANKNNRLLPYTHLSVPIASLSLSILCSTFASNSQPVRSVYHNKFVKQSCSTGPSTIDKDFVKKVPVRHNNYTRMVRTVADDVYNYGSAPVVVAILPDGNNQEDSITISQSLAERGCYTVEILSSTSIELEGNQQVETPVVGEVIGTKTTDFSHLVAGLPKKGTIITQGMPIIGVVTKLKNGKKKDSSKYRYESSPIKIINAETNLKQSIRIVKVSYMTYTPLDIGDKFGATSGCKGVVSCIKPDHMMPMTEDGIRIQMLINPHSIPTRMVIGQLLEGALGITCSAIGNFGNGTHYKPYDNDRIDKINEKVGIPKNCLHTLYNGRTGQRMKAKVAVILNGYERLTKFVREISAATEIPRMNRYTKKLDRGIPKGGGSRMGFMEIDVLVAHGGSRLVTDVLFNDSNPTNIFICNTCGNVAPCNPEQKIYICKCKNTTFSEMNTVGAFPQLISYLNGLGVNVEIIPNSPLF